MVTKSKKWKNIVSFGAFVLGSNLLLISGLSIVREVCWSVYNRQSMEVFRQDYQSTTEFQYQIEDYLSNFLAISVGEAPNGYWFEETYDSQIVDALESGDTYTYEKEYGDEWKSTWNDDSFEEERELTPEQKKECIEQYIEGRSEDSNLLYRVSCGGKVLYTNMPDCEWQQWGDVLPEGYNFAVQYKDGSVQMSKDGKELDVYKDGYYENGTDWFVPGYENFTVDEGMLQSEVVMFVAKEPKNYMNIKYGNGAVTQYASGIYWTYENNMQRCLQMKYSVAGILIGSVLMVFYLCTRREKREVDAWIAGFTGTVWVEVKILCFLILPFIAIVVTMRNEMVLLLLWGIYFAVNDMRKNPKSFWNGIVIKMIHAMEMKNLTSSFSKRMIKRYLGVIGVGIFLGAGMLVYFLVGYNSFYYENEQIVYGVVGIIALLFFIAVSYLYLMKIRQQAKDLDLLRETIAAVHDGGFGKNGQFAEIALPKNSELSEMAVMLNDIGTGMEVAIEERMKSERMKVELVANVSHDIKTPLTSIISYIQFLKQEEDLPEYVKDYIRILDEKSERLKNMVQDIFSVSKAASGQLPVELEVLDFGKLVRQTLADMDEEIAKSSLVIKTELPESAMLIKADGKRMYRVFQNLIQNVLKYSLDGSRVFITLVEKDGLATASIKNISKQELSTEKDFTERFVRGDESRTDGGSGLGLSIAKSFTEACGGSFCIDTIADLFMVKVEFPVVENEIDSW